MVQLRGNLTQKMEDNAGKVRFRHLKAMTVGSRISLIVLLLVCMIAVLANIIAPHNPYEIFTARMAPDSQFLFGTDDKGRDVLSRMMYGARYSLVIGLGATAFALVAGSIVGAIAAVSRKWVSEVIMRICDIVMSFPGIALAATFVLSFGASIPSLIFAIGFLYIPQLARIVRANIVSEYGQDYVRAVIVSGARAPWILVKHVVRNCLAPVMVFTIVLVADAIVFEASLSFISAGIPEPTPTWGNILADARNGVLSGRWWQALFPGLAIMVTVLCLNILSEGITDAMAAAPKAPVTASDSALNGEREADRLVADPTLAYKAQAAELEHRPLPGAHRRAAHSGSQRSVHQVPAPWRCQRCRSRELRGSPAPDHGFGGRIWLRQVHHKPHYHGIARPQGSGFRPDHVQRPESAGT